MAETAYDPQLDEDYLSPEEREKIRALFKPAVVRGNFPERPRFVPPEASPWTPGEVFWAVVGAGLLGFAVGHVWHKLREHKERKHEGKPRVVALGLTRGVVVSR